ncbi:universal stress protein [Ramlibacter sp. USB13]|uniref:Universal stress protein n=1 Tax=Ramlibacter cellulosilyticus TaxID=2764187 RepID=A0A923SBC1_9BURK|nr:universal stress protein [Ramlibacter cellulosilyticus]MBC5783700.1 universal stress protein [Ramlibacter cellulosilyticus]
MTIRSMLVATDLSVQDRWTLQRAWHIARAHGATVRLMYLPPAGQPMAATAAARLAQTVRELEQAHGLRVQVVAVRQEQSFDDLVAQARGADLVVLPHRRERSTAAFFRGQPVLRLLRSAGRPVLVLRRATNEHYRRILVAVDLLPGSAALVQFAADLEERAGLEIFHAVGTREEAVLRSAEAAEKVVRAYRAGRLRRAQERLVTLSDSFTARRNRVLAMAGRGDPGRQAVVQQERSRADLVVLGKGRSSAWGDFFCGSVAHRVLSWGSSDVLVVPDAHLQASAQVAPRRIHEPSRPALALSTIGRRAP